MPEPRCNKGVRSRRNCYPLWDSYPCWVKEHRACYNNSGDTQYFDPLADIMRSLSYVVEYVHNAFISSIADIPQDRLRETTRSHYFEFLNDYATTLIPIQNPVLRNIDNSMVRYLDVDEKIDELLSKAEGYVNRLGDTIRALRLQGNMSNAVGAIQAPQTTLLRRNSQEEGGGGKKRKKRKKTRKYRKSKRSRKSRKYKKYKKIKRK